ncbi:MAG: hypothetical protein RQ894_01770 [Candidatus Pacebacteria bacterium]|nr:hypothetical protein [Candidatus Paceibacterota bacterium]
MKFLKAFVFIIYFFLPLLIWLFIFFQGETYLVIFKSKSGELVLPTSRLHFFVLFLYFLQFLNLFLLFLNKEFFGKIIYVFIFFHLLLTLKVYFFNFY